MFGKLLRSDPVDPAPPLSLALQGGGAHGAYTWGVLDRLLEDNWQIEGISGTSAGAMNAVALAQGWTTGGAEGARAALKAFWMAVGDSAPFDLELMQGLNPAQNGGLPPSLNMMLGLARLFSPSQLNPFELNPLRDVVSAQFDFERLRRSCPLKLFIAATAVRTGKVHLFRTQDLSAEALLASACLPTLQRAVEIDGEHYWDGGYTANPAIYPLIYECSTADILLVLLSPLVHDEAPRSAQEIATRSMEFGFSTTFLREMRMITHMRSYISEQKGWLPPGKLERRVMGLRFHLVDAPELSEIGVDSKLNASTRFLLHLHELGRSRAEAWVRAHRQDVGARASIDLQQLFA